MKMSATFISKIFVSIFAFVLVLVSSSASLANEGGKSEEKENFIVFPHKEADLSQSKIPGKATLTAPAYYSKISGTSVKLEWTAAADAEQYHLQVATDPNFKWTIANEQNLKATSFDVSNLEPGKHYFWRVVGVRPNNKAGHTKGFWAMSMFETTGEATK